jgi:hypothetical protein
LVQSTATHAHRDRAAAKHPKTQQTKTAATKAWQKRHDQCHIYRYTNALRPYCHNSRDGAPRCTRHCCHEANIVSKQHWSANGARKGIQESKTPYTVGCFPKCRCCKATASDGQQTDAPGTLCETFTCTLASPCYTRRCTRDVWYCHVLVCL